MTSQICRVCLGHGFLMNPLNHEDFDDCPECHSTGHAADERLVLRGHMKTESEQDEPEMEWDRVF